MNKQRLYVSIVSIIGMLATLMPWISVSAFSMTRNFAGTDGEGIIALFLFSVACALCFVGNKQEKFEKNFVYGLWAIGGLNIVIFLVVFSKAGEATRLMYGLGKMSLVHGAYLAFLVALAIILFTVEQLQLVNKVDSFIASKKNSVSSTSTSVEQVAQVLPVQEVVEPIQEENALVVEAVQEDVQENLIEVIEESSHVASEVTEEVLQVVSVVQEETSQTVSEVKEDVEQVVEDVKEVADQISEELAAENSEA